MRRKITKPFSKKFKAIDPGSNWKLLWDFYLQILFSIVYFFATICIVSEKYNFNQAYYTQNTVFRNICLISFLISIPISSYTGYYQNGILIMKKRKIVKNYLKKSFIFNALALLPFFANSSPSYGGFQEHPAFILIELCVFFNLH